MFQKIGIAIAIAILIYYIVQSITKHQEGFTWASTTVTNYVNLSMSKNPSWSKDNATTDATNVETWATDEEANAYITSGGVWPYTTPFIQVLTDVIKKTRPKAADADVAKQINGIQTVMPQKLAQYMISSRDPTLEKIQTSNLRCNISSTGTSGTGMIQIDASGNQIAVNNSELPSMITGFKFLYGVCNPCNALSHPPNYNCPFTITDASGNSDLSPILQYDWGLGQYSLGATALPNATAALLSITGSDPTASTAATTATAATKSMMSNIKGLF